MAKPPRPPKQPAVAEPFGGPSERASSTTAPEVARYIAGFTLELSSLAKEAKLDLLAYLLDMARLEADRVGREKP